MPCQADAAEWRLVEMAQIAGLRLRSCSPLDASALQGYEPPAAAAASAMVYVLFEPPAKVDPEEVKAAQVAAMRKAHPELRIGPTGQTYKEAWKQRQSKFKAC